MRWPVYHGMKLLLAVIAVISSRNLSIVAEELLEPWKLSCLRTHNSLRHIHGLKEVEWNEFLHSIAGIKAATLVMEDYRIGIHIPPLNVAHLKKDRIFFNQEKSTEKRSMSSPERNLQLSIITEKMISDWCYKSEIHQLEKSSYVLDPRVDKIGCSMNVVATSDNSMQVYLIVSYQMNLEKMPSTTLPATTTESFVETQSSKVCKVECPDAGMCLSYSYREYLDSEYCACNFDRELWTFGTYKRVPRCEGVCFVYCPFANARQRRTCRGRVRCTCLYARSGAVCE